MKTIHLNAELRQLLPTPDDEVALLDEDGKVVAHLIPPGHRQMLYSLVNQSIEVKAVPGLTDPESFKMALAELRQELAKAST